MKQTNEWMHLCYMSNQRMLAMYRANCLTAKAIEFLHNLRINEQQMVTADQADWLMHIQDAVNEFTAYHQHAYASYDAVTDDDVTEMLLAFSTPQYNTSWRKN